MCRKKEIDETSSQGIIEDYKNGMLKSKIQEKYNISESWLYHFLKRSGVPMRAAGNKGGRNPEVAARNKEIVRLYVEKHKEVQIAKHYDLTPAMVSKILKSAGVIVIRGQPPETVAAVLADAETLKVKDLVGKHNLTETIIRFILRRHGKNDRSRTTERVQLIAQAYAEGLSIVEIKEKFSITRAAIDYARYVTGTPCRRGRRE